MNKQQKLIRFLQICTALLLVAKGTTFLSEEQPFREVFQHSEEIQISFGILLILFGLLVLIPFKLIRKYRIYYSFFVPAIILFIHSFCGYIKAGFVLEQMIEYSLQIFLPIVLMNVIRCRSKEIPGRIIELKVLVALTFVGHAMFAIGYHYIPGNFMQMTMTILKLNAEQSTTFLLIVGIIDILCAIAIFIGLVKEYAIYYLIGWGMLTAFARLWFGIGIGASLQDIFTIYLPNMVYRLPHGLIPLMLFIIAQRQRNVEIKRKPLVELF